MLWSIKRLAEIATGPTRFQLPGNTVNSSNLLMTLLSFLSLHSLLALHHFSNPFFSVPWPPISIFPIVAPGAIGVPSPGRINWCDRSQSKERLEWEKPVYCLRWGQALLFPSGYCSCFLATPASAHLPLRLSLLGESLWVDPWQLTDDRPIT